MNILFLSMTHEKSLLNILRIKSLRIRPNSRQG